MFDRFIRLARARKALREQRFFDALRQASDPLIEADRRAERIRAKATEALVERGRKRLEKGDLSTAVAEVEQLRRLASRELGEAVERLGRDVDAAAGQRDVERGERQQLHADVRSLFEAGELGRASERLGDAADADANALRERIRLRREQALEVAEGALGGLSDETVHTAIEQFQRALGLDRDLSAQLQTRGRQQLARAASAALTAALDRREVAAALATFGRLQAQDPDLLAEPAVGGAVTKLIKAVEKQLRSLGSLDGAAELARAVRAADLPLEGPVEGPLDDVLAALSALPTDGGIPDSVLLAKLQQGAQDAGLGPLAKLASKALRGQADAEKRLAVARQLLEQGQLETARGMFVEFLNEHPLHEGVQKELELVDQGLADLDRRLADVRLLLRAGKLREACTGAMALVGSARIAAEAQQILAEARSRMALVDKGLDEVRVALHSRAAATPDGVRHCLKRIEELAKVQVDHGELDQVAAAVTAELEGLDACERAMAAVSRNDLAVAAELVPDLVASRDRLLGAERIDAKLCQLGDALLRVGDRALHDGRLAIVESCAALLARFSPVRDDFEERAASFRLLAAEQQQSVDQLLADAREQLGRRDLAEAERLVELAEKRWCESTDVRAMREQLRKLRKQADTLEQVATLTEEKDFLGAQQKLASMRAVPAMLRTRVYDMKQDLARAQGLEGAFMLRVDEGGEQLVMRGESVTIGNVRQASADLPVLANLAGRHASLRRSMSFHGGMQDTIVAEDGEVRVDGKSVKKAVLASGQKIALGPALGLLYQRPTERSLTSRVLLQSGFQIAGTDRILLMKDRGRDGRILLGPGRDVHVTVPKAVGEVELFASNTGQMRVACELGGTIDGQSFKGEHPVSAGQIVEAAGISFLLLPWQP